MEEYTPITVESYLTKKPSEKLVILRHDVDRKPENALRMAKLENDFGIISTYYIRMKKDVFKQGIIKEIANMEHEIGYHYEVLDKAKGDFEKAIEIFEEELEKFREVCEVKTACMHGNPFTPWINKDLWKKYDFKDFGIVGEPYLSIDYKNVLYLTDTGRKWDSRFSVKDVVNANINQVIEKIKSTDDVIRLINKGDIEQMCILAHPNRWSDSFGGWLRELVGQNIKNVGKVGIKWYAKHGHDF
jgi:hypothetical protein